MSMGNIHINMRLETIYSSSQRKLGTRLADLLAFRRCQVHPHEYGELGRGFPNAVHLIGSSP